jgi:hypothetical protein
MLAAALLVSAKVSTLVHVALVEHATCAEHGESVHTSGTGAERPIEDLIRSDAPGGAAETHEHCEACAVARSDDGLRPATAAVGLPGGGAPAAESPPDLVSPSVATLRVAPKQSPPV